MNLPDLLKSSSARFPPEHSFGQLTELIQKSISAALISAERERLFDHPTSGGTVADKFHGRNEPLPVDPPAGSLGILRPHLRRQINQKTGDILYIGIVPSGHPGYQRHRPQGKNLEAVRRRFREMLESDIEKNLLQVELTPKEKHMAQTTFSEFKKFDYGMSYTEIFQTGLAVAKAKKDFGLTNNIVEDGISIGRKKSITLGQAVIQIVSLTRAPKRKPERWGNSQAQVKRAVLAHLVTRFGAETSLHKIISDFNPIQQWINDNLISDASPWSLNYRSKSYGLIKGFFRDISSLYDIPKLPDLAFGRRPIGVKNEVKAPGPIVVEKLLFLVQEEEPSLLLFVIFQVFLGIRPEEAYRVLSNVRIYLLPNCIKLPKEITKTGPRMIRIRPAAYAWMTCVLVENNKLKTDFRPFNPHKLPLSFDHLQHRVNQLLKRSGWQGRIPKEALRKSFLSALIAGKINRQLIMQEAGHRSESTLLRHYDALWEYSEAINYFSIFPSPPVVVFSPSELMDSFKDPELKVQQLSKA